MNIYVSNLSDKITDESLRVLFSTYGRVDSTEIIMDVFTDSSRGFAFVEMPDETEAANAIEKLHLSVIDGMAINAKESKPRVEHKGSYAVGSKPKKN